MAKKPAKKKSKFVKVTLKKAPPGTYDIGLDASERAAGRGYANLLSDLKLGKRRNVTDYGIGQSEVARQRTELGQDLTTARADVERQYGQTLQDLLSQQQGVERGYQQLGNRQRQSFQAAGLADGGAGQQAQAKRATNQAIDIAPITVARTRATEGRQLSLDDLLRQQTRGGQALDRALGQTSLNYQRGATDAARQQKQQHTELVEYRKDVGKAKMQQFLEQGNLRTAKVPRKQAKKWKRQGVI